MKNRSNALLPGNQKSREYELRSDMAPPTIIHYGRRADGSEAVISDPNPPDRGLVVTQTPHSDGTVPLMSAQGLFPGERDLA